MKDAAEACGRDTSKYGSHSLRRGGACAYLLAGVDVHMIAIWGRWADVKTDHLYIEPAVASLMKGAQGKVNNSEVEPNLKLRTEEKPRAEQPSKGCEAVANNCGYCLPAGWCGTSHLRGRPRWSELADVIECFILQRAAAAKNAQFNLMYVLTVRACCSGGRKPRVDDGLL